MDSLIRPELLVRCLCDINNSVGESLEKGKREKKEKEKEREKEVRKSENKNRFTVAQHGMRRRERVR